MTLPIHDNDRQVIPRWRDATTTAALGELDSLLAPKPVQVAQGHFINERIAAWDSHRSISFATDLVGTALVLGEEPKALEAAKFILKLGKAASPIARELASRVMGDVASADTALRMASDVGSLERGEAQERIHSLRLRLRNYPRNPVAWVDLSRAYASLGVTKRSVEAMDRALVLAPDNRFVLRSGSRLFVHIGEPDRALTVLRRAHATREDPWLLAAEIAVSGTAKEGSRFAKVGGQILRSNEFTPFHTSELASALATLEYSSGSVRDARKLFRLSIQSPTENAVAQAEWASRRFKLVDLEPRLFQIPGSYEAKAKEYLQAGKLKDALAASWAWLRDQFFSSEPAVHGSYIASVGMQDYQEAIRIVRAGMIANPKNWILLNNLAFSLASTNQVDEAEKALPEVSPGDQIGKGTLYATKGLIEFRRGHRDEGRRLYAEAIETFNRPEMSKMRALAAVFLAREELFAKTPEADAASIRAEQFLKGLEAPELATWKRIIRPTR